MNQTQALQTQPFDPHRMQRLYDRHQPHDVRQRLDAIKRAPTS